MSAEHKAVVDQATGEIYVDPKKDCPHIGQHVGANITADVISKAFEEGSCHGCADKTENWVCLHCGQVNCSRYVNSHASKHYEDTQHGIAISFSDLSVWCYLCDWYIASPDLMPHISAVYKSKFGKVHPAMKKKGKRSKDKDSSGASSNDKQDEQDGAAPGSSSSSSASK
eukprot:TRINITY_DN2349_c0_g1_i3.p1 TRINITY_DN2349_c0_g1~~TRINITY_DN2349_c0_g1_i3.p1  ORF type:complete len:170 (-),score=31.27 TRINITY_DN2349_c0_g1_i3:35-544(-)